MLESTKISIRFAGDSGDGMQLAGERFTSAAAQAGDDVSTLSDFPAEIRAPAGSLSGVSGFQVSFGSEGVNTPGDSVDVLVAMNPAAFKTNIHHLKEGGLILVNKDGFTERNFKKAGYESSPLDSVSEYQIVELEMSKLVKNALQGMELKSKEVERSKNFLALGVMLWLFDKPIEITLSWLDQKFAKRLDIAEANKQALQAGWNVALSLGLTKQNFSKRKKEQDSGEYRYITGNKALALGLVAASQKSEKSLFLGSYPITPASDILHYLSDLKNYDVVTFQAEDEMAAIGAAIGASYGGSLGVTSTSGPGFALKSEFLNLAVMTELPLVVVDVQRGGPSTGMPTKTSQGDLLQALWGRNGDSSLIVLAAQSPSDCFDMAVEAARLTMKFMTPVVLMSDYYLANGAQVWKLPTYHQLPEFEFSSDKANHNELEPYSRNPETLARPWIAPGTENGQHRIGGLEKEPVTGHVSFNSEHHKQMNELRFDKVNKVALDIPEQQIIGDPEADILLIGWGSTYGAILSALHSLQEKNIKVAMTQIRYVHPFAKNLESLIKSYKKVLVIENNLGQLSIKIAGEFGVPLETLNKAEGLPFKQIEIEDKVMQILGGQNV